MNKSYFGEEYYCRRHQPSTFFPGKDIFLKYLFWDRVIRKRVRRGKLLDIGCAEGFLLKWAERRGYDTYGLDISDFAVKELSRKKLDRTDLLVASVTALPFIADYFELVTCFDVLEHLEQPLIALKEINRCLKMGGMLVISVPNTSSYGITLKGNSWFGYRDATHVSLLTPQEWENLLQQNGFEINSRFYDTLWDPPYFKRIPTIIQRSVCYAVQQLQLTPLRFPKQWGENLYVIARKKRG